MEKFFNSFLGKSVVYTTDKLIIDSNDNEQLNIIKFIKKVIFKHDVVVELKRTLNSIFSSEVPVTKNNIIKALIKKLSMLIQSDEDIKTKNDIFSCIFRAFVSSCKEEEIMSVMQFFIVLTQIIGFNVNSKKTLDKSECGIYSENIRNFLNVDVIPPSLDSFTILKELMLNLSKTAIYLNSEELQPYNKWLQKLLKTLATTKPFFNIIMELFCISADIELKIVEGNLDVIFCSIFSQEKVDNNFEKVYSIFFKHIFNVCVKFQRTVKFVERFLSIVKACPPNLAVETILPPNAIAEFSKTVAVVLSNQQCLLLFDVLMQSLNDCVNFFVEQNEFQPFVLLVTTKLLVCFLKEVKLFAPSIASSTLQNLINHLNKLRGILQKFGNYLCNNKKSLKNEIVTKAYLELCFYCGEIESLINCYKDSVLLPSKDNQAALDGDCQSCINEQLWGKLVALVLKSKLRSSSEICFHVAIQKLRTSQLEQLALQTDDSTVKLVFYQLTSDLREFNVFQNLFPDNFNILMEILTKKQLKAIIKNVFLQALENNNNVEWKTWISHSTIQENSFFIVCLFSDILKETERISEDFGVSEKPSWFSEDYFNKELCVRDECLERLPEKMNVLLRNGKKVRKSLAKTSDGKCVKRLTKVFDIFKRLPLAYMKDGFKRLGLSFAVAVGILVSDENSSDLVLDSILKFLSSGTDPSVCFDVGLCIKWLSELSYRDRNLVELKNKTVETLVHCCPGSKFGLSQIRSLVDSSEKMKQSSSGKMLETRIVLYNELGKCGLRSRKRKSDTDLIGSYRAKLAKIICDGAKELEGSKITSENCEILFKTFFIELNKAGEAKEENEMKTLGNRKLPLYFEFAAKSLEKKFDDSSASFLAALLQSMPQCRQFLAEDAFFRIWTQLKAYEKVDSRLFCIYSSDDEFNKILDDLLTMCKKYLRSESLKESFLGFEIWISFFTASSDTKKKLCQVKLVEFFNYVHHCGAALKHLPVKKQILLVKFLIFCINSEKVIVTPEILDTIIHVLVQCVNECLDIEDFQALFEAEVEAASGILLRQFAWSRSKVHLSFVVFQRLSRALMKKCDAAQEFNTEDVVKLSTCGFFLEKWVSLMVKEDKDFARISAYFLSVLISFIASVTVLPAVKIHLSNCINHFLSISDSHTVAYLMRLLKPGYQQVFNVAHDQFNKYHRYSGKI